MVIFMVGLFFLTLDISIVSKAYKKIEQYYFPKNEKDPKNRLILFILLIGNLTILYVSILIIYKIVILCQSL